MTDFSTKALNNVAVFEPGDSWSPVGDLFNKDWIEIGDYIINSNHYPGKSHVLNVGYFPSWDLDLTLYPIFNKLIIVGLKGKAGRLSNPSSCKLGENGKCGTPFSGSRIAISSTYPFGITSMNNIIEGYSESFCLRCDSSTGSESFDYDGLLVTQNGDCSTKL